MVNNHSGDVFFEALRLHAKTLWSVGGLGTRTPAGRAVPCPWHWKSTNALIVLGTSRLVTFDFVSDGTFKLWMNI